MKGRALPHGAAGLDREAPRAGVGPVCIQAPVSSSVKRGELHLPVTIREYVSVQSFLADLQCVSCTMLGVGDTVMQALPCWGLWPRPDSNQGRLLGGRDTTLKSSTPGTGPGRHPREPRVWPLAAGVGEPGPVPSLIPQLPFSQHSQGLSLGIPALPVAPSFPHVS